MTRSIRCPRQLWLPLVALLVALLIVLRPHVALAGPPLQPPPPPNAMSEWMATQWNNLIIEVLKAVATLAWSLEKIAASITRFLTDNDAWTTLLQSVLGLLQGVMPSILQSLLFAPNGAGGLLYLAFWLSGIFLILPNVGTARLVELSRVIIWGAVLGALFVSATAGYDLIGSIEQLRTSMVQDIIQTTSATNDLDTLVAAPMLATNPSIRDHNFVLSPPFEAYYYPEVDPGDMEEFVIFELFGRELKITYETQASREARREKAEQGMAVALLTLLPGYVLLMFGIIFATLAAASLVLIMFFMVALPLGFFEFGTAILKGIVKQYLYLFAITLLAVVLAGMTVAAGLVDYQTSSPIPTPNDIMEVVPVLLLVVIAITYVGRMASAAMLDTFGVVSTSIQQSMTPLAYAGSLPAAGGIPGAGALGVLGAGAAALATGGMSAALMATGGAALSQINSGTGKAAATVASSASKGRSAHVFAAAASGRGASGVAATNFRHNRQETDRDAQAAQRATSAYRTAQGAESGRVRAEWGARDAGAYLTTDQRHLDEAEKAYDAGKTVEARQHLERAFGNRDVAERVLGVYQREGKQGQQRVRGIVEATQTVAGGMTHEGRNLFDRQGKATGAFSQTLQGELRDRRLFDPRDQADAALVGQIAGATVRQPVGIWNTPDGARQLARETLHPQEAREVIPGDVSAQYQLHDLAQQHDWGEAQMETLFEATKLGQGASAVSRHGAAPEVAALLRKQGEWDSTSEPLLKEASRLALLVAEDAQAQRGVTVEMPVAPPAAAPTVEPSQPVEVPVEVPVAPSEATTAPLRPLAASEAATAPLRGSHPSANQGALQAAESAQQAPDARASAARPAALPVAPSPVSVPPVVPAAPVPSSPVVSPPKKENERNP